MIENKIKVQYTCWKNGILFKNRLVSSVLTHSAIGEGDVGFDSRAGQINVLMSKLKKMIMTSRN